MPMKNPHVLELLWQQRHCFEHILLDIFLCLDSSSIRNLKCISWEMREFIHRIFWKNSRARDQLKKRLKTSWMTRLDAEESAFQCSDDVYDMKICHESVICGLRNGTVEIWNTRTMKKELSLEEQQGSVQVDANEKIVVGVSSDSTVFIWDRATGALREVMYHHRASVWGIRIQDNWIITGSMDGTISVVDIETLQLKKHFLAHENEWGISDLDTTPNLIVSGCFDRLLRVWTLPDCNLIRTIPAKHAINCVSVCDDLVAACSRTGKVAGTPNVIIWRISTGDLVRTLDVPSCCFVKLDCDKLVTLVAAGDGIIGEHHMVKWPIAKILILYRPSDLDNENAKNAKWDVRNTKNKAEILLRYQRTPAVISCRTMLVYAQPRTRGMCSVLDFWP